MSNPNHDIESAFFEFSKMSAFLSTGVTIRVPKIPIVPIGKAQEYVDSLILVDLISVIDKAIDHVFKAHKLKQERRKSKFTILEENGHIYNPRYLEWYRSWRHQTAHDFIRHESFKVAQAIRDVTTQLQQWGLVSAKLDYRNYHHEQQNGVVKIGATVSDIPILEYDVWSDNPSGGSSRLMIDLSWNDFKTTYSAHIREIMSKR